MRCVSNTEAVYPRCLAYFTSGFFTGLLQCYKANGLAFMFQHLGCFTHLKNAPSFIPPEATSLKSKSHKVMADSEWMSCLRKFASSGAWPAGEGNRPAPRQKEWYELYQRVRVYTLHRIMYLQLFTLTIHFTYYIVLKMIQG